MHLFIAQSVKSHPKNSQPQGRIFDRVSHCHSGNSPFRERPATLLREGSHSVVP